MRSLVVEDELTSRMLLKHFLDEFGDCDTAEDFEKALDSFKQARSSDKPFDLICLDIQLPGADGHQILKNIRQTESEMGLPYEDRVKVFMTTAHSDLGNVWKAFHELCDEYLSKPITKESLHECLKKHGLID